jgi:hypothetical protein
MTLQPLAGVAHSRERSAPAKGTSHGSELTPQERRATANATSAAKSNWQRKTAIRKIFGAGARDAQRAGDEIEMENCFQHAEHYFRMMQSVGGADERSLRQWSKP